MNNFTKSLLKIFFAAVLIFALIKSDQLDFKQLRIVLEKPEVFIFNFAIWLFGAVILGGFRWFILLKGMGIDLSYFKVVRFHLIGLFFNTAMPGAVGGDIIKALYVVKEQDANRKTPALMSILLDRVVGVMGLVVMAMVAALALTDNMLASSKIMATLIGFIYILFGVLVAAFAWILLPITHHKDPIAIILSKSFPGSKLLSSVYKALCNFRGKSRYLLFTILLTIGIQMLTLSYVWYVAGVINGELPSFINFMLVFPLGVLTTAIPLVPGGMGVGHIAFEQLFRLINVDEGANIFNIFVLGQLLFNLLGFFSYIFAKSRVFIDESRSTDPT